MGFPWGGREAGESVYECFNRELQEEFALTISEDAIVWRKVFPAMHDPTVDAYFMVVKLPESVSREIQFGNEGQKWDMFSEEDFLSRTDVVPHLKERLETYLNETSGAGY